MPNCPCGSNKLYGLCCGKFLSHEAFPQTPEELMRSRYTAYFEGNMDYIAETMKSPAADRFDPVAAKKRAQHIQWVDLKVVQTSQDKNTGTVEFYASYSDGRKIHVLHEISNFIRENGKWFYISGVFP